MGPEFDLLCFVTTNCQALPCAFNGALRFQSDELIFEFGSGRMHITLVSISGDSESCLPLYS
jgi:hypothetical protein